MTGRFPVDGNHLFYKVGIPSNVVYGVETLQPTTATT